MIKCSKPTKNYKPSNITQGFHPEHKAVDIGGKYGEFIVAPFNSKVASVVGAEVISPDLNYLRGGYGVRLISTEDPTISMVFWHCLGVFPIKKGDIVIQGQPIAQMGNSGFVMSGGKYVEIDIRNKPPYPGTHTHVSMGQETNGVYTHLDYSKLIDLSIPV